MSVIPSNTPKEALTTKILDIRVQDGQYVLYTKGPRGYSMHVKIGMYCLGLQSAKLVMWAQAEHIELEVPFDKVFVITHIRKLRSFYFQHTLPKLVDDFMKGRLQVWN